MTVSHASVECTRSYVWCAECGALVSFCGVDNGANEDHIYGRLISISFWRVMLTECVCVVCVHV